MKRLFAVVFALCILLVGMIIPLSFPSDTGTVADHKAMGSTRAMTNVRESEPNGNSGSADVLNRADAPMNLTGNLTTPSDDDWFRIDLVGGGATTDNVSLTFKSCSNWSSSEGLIISILGAYPGSSDSTTILVDYWWRNDGSWPVTWFHASYNGTYYFYLWGAFLDGDNDYEIWINVTSNTTVDTYNNIETAKTIYSDVIQENVSMQFERAVPVAVSALALVSGIYNPLTQF